MTEKKKEKTISEKPRYGMWNNAWFMIGKAWKYEKSVLAVLVMSIILEVIMNLLNLYIGPVVLKRAGRGMDVKNTIPEYFYFCRRYDACRCSTGLSGIEPTVWTD